MFAVGSRFIPRQADASDNEVARPRRYRAEKLPAGRVVSIDTNQLDEFNQYATGWSVRYHPLNSTKWRTRMLLAGTPSLQLGFVRHAVGYSSQGENPAGTLSIVVPIDEKRPMVHRGHDIGPMQMGLIRSGEGYECVSRFGAEFVIASVARESLERHAADLWHTPDEWRDLPDRLQFVDSAHRSGFLDACRRILGEVSEKPGVFQDPRPAALLEERFLEALFRNTHEASASVSGRSRYSLARQAYRYLLDRDDEVPSIREICAVTGASYATLERGFRETYGMTPKAMMTAMRLSGARRTLLHSDPSTTVTDAALRWGFVELGRFSVLYRHRYGEAPSETLRRTRKGP